MAEFKDRVKKLRLDHNLTQDELAQVLGISRSTIGMYETGKREADYETLELIADYFNVDMNYLIGWTDEHMIGKKWLMKKEFVLRMIMMAIQRIGIR